MIDLWQEIYGTIKRNKLRTALTGFAVAWGIFILILLLGTGNGVMNAQNEQMASLAMNSIKVGAGWTSKPYDGLSQGRRVQLNNADLAITRNMRKNVENAGAVIYQSGMNISYGNEYVNERLMGVHPNYLEIERPTVVEGRFINQLDIKEKRKVAILNQRSVKTLFKHGAKPLGKMLNIGGVMFQVVGVYKDKGNSSGQDVFVPFSTLQIVYNKGDKLNNILMSIKDLNTKEENKAFEADYRAAIGAHQRFDKTDDGAIWIWNRFTQMTQMNKGADYMRTAIWIIGLFTLLSGIVGVSNIMLITVKERTREFGIRKALGARPWSILKLVIVESVGITAFFGYIGMVAGVGVTEYMNMTAGKAVMDIGIEQQTMFLNPTVDLGIAIRATMTLIVAGTLAGLFPALKAVKTRPIEALRAD
ncbi:putative ABC transport system permease protein [Bacteroides zoogleoformans]|uniref:ABC transporter permease n=1 Tax=Bacteroides zoogleoformans TaxID=28119 RepID=A0ABM6TAM1_9BACE|nr:ABC transporter permease [Bacteroides zoogleoformans]AVM53840.1 ABC transporter permease [Bacteroides zoogleoformans]TWJ10956.1 putative ABC transport system permease protein [Bacteroides zoogleoformans]